MSFYSILFDTAEDREDAIEAPVFFPDLNCDQIVAAIIAGKQEYDLAPFFHAPLRRIDAITYRHELMQDVEQPPLSECLDVFARSMREVRGSIARINKLRCREQQQAELLDAIELYCNAIRSLAHALATIKPRSRGFRRFQDYLCKYAESRRFDVLSTGVKGLKAALAKVEYCVQIQGDGFAVRRHRGEPNYSVDIEATFEKFKQGANRDYRVKFSDGDDMNHVEAKILEFIARLHPEVFVDLAAFCAEHYAFIDPTVAAFDREVQFYVAYLEYIAGLRAAGLQFCYPRMSRNSKEIFDYSGFDIALAHKLIAQKSKLVSNDFRLAGQEGILVVSGPNQGGKTTFARMFGQLHYLASIGCPVPGRAAQLFLFDRLHTRFEKQERIENHRGKLEEDLVAVHEIFKESTSQSIIIMNEVFTSTTIQDEIFLSKKVMERILELGALCVWVTFVDELASFAPQTVSMVSTVAAEDPAQRTFKIVRRPADGLAYAMAIAGKHGLTHDSIVRRIRP